MLSGPVLAAGNDPVALPWEKAYLNLGYYLANLNSSVRLGESKTGIGLDLNVEDLLDLDSSGGVFRIEGGWRFSKNKRHKVELGWFSFNRSGSKTIVDPIEVPPELGGGTISGQFNSTFDFDIIKAKYEYSFLLDDRVDVNIGAGLFVMPFKIGILVQSGSTRQINESITAPLPVLSLGFDIVLTPKWYLRQQTDFFYLEIDDYEGGIADIQVAIEYLPWKNFGFGLGFDFLSIRVKASEETDVPGLGDFKGDIEFDTNGIQLYLKALF
jgi:hypothetical protein